MTFITYSWKKEKSNVVLVKKLKTVILTFHEDNSLLFLPQKNAIKVFLVSLQMSSLPLNTEQNVQKSTLLKKEEKQCCLSGGQKQNGWNYVFHPKKLRSTPNLERSPELGKNLSWWWNCLFLGQKIRNINFVTSFPCFVQIRRLRPPARKTDQEEKHKNYWRSMDLL